MVNSGLDPVLSNESTIMDSDVYPGDWELFSVFFNLPLRTLHSRLLPGSCLGSNETNAMKMPEWRARDDVKLNCALQDKDFRMVNVYE
jgi:hypothetical protein